MIWPKRYSELKFGVKKSLRKVVPKYLLDIYFSTYPLLGSMLFRRPSRKLTVIGITGTDGKSSTVLLTAKILQEAGFKVGYFSSVSQSDGIIEKNNAMKMTMPGRLFMQHFLAQLVYNRCDVAIIEVTSEGILQKRHLCIDFDIVAITNLKPEHIQSHGSFANYKAAKETIFRNLHTSFHKGVPKVIITNNDDKESGDFAQFDSDKKISFGTASDSTIKMQPVEQTLYKNIFKISKDSKTISIKINIGGPFILDNATAAIAISSALGANLEQCKNALEKVSTLQGRFEIVSKEPLIIVDYAHTVAAVEKITSFVRHNWHGEIIHIFGAAGGGRDVWKRPVLAKLSEKFTHSSILTEENSFDENTHHILEQIIEGFENKHRVTIIPNRTDAVKEAVCRITSSTLLLFTGKGSESVIAGPLGSKKLYNEKECIQLCISDKNSSVSPLQ